MRSLLNTLSTCSFTGLTGEIQRYIVSDSQRFPDSMQMCHKELSKHQCSISAKSGFAFIILQIPHFCSKFHLFQAFLCPLHSLWSSSRPRAAHLRSLNLLWAFSVSMAISTHLLCYCLLKQNPPALKVNQPSCQLPGDITSLYSTYMCVTSVTDRQSCSYIHCFKKHLTCMLSAPLLTSLNLQVVSITKKEQCQKCWHLQLDTEKK